VGTGLGVGLAAAVLEQGAGGGQDGGVVDTARCPDSSDDLEQRSDLVVVAVGPEIDGAEEVPEQPPERGVDEVDLRGGRGGRGDQVDRSEEMGQGVNEGVGGAVGGGPQPAKTQRRGVRIQPQVAQTGQRGDLLRPALLERVARTALAEPAAVVGQRG
jgi:hypothetical protein